MRHNKAYEQLLTATENKLKVAQSRKRKADKTNETLLQAVKKLKSEISDEKLKKLEEKCEEIPDHLFNLYKEKKDTGTLSQHAYHPSIRSFALTCHLYSPKAYRFVKMLSFIDLYFCHIN